jgi:hypothetical protein
MYSFKKPDLKKPNKMVVAQKFGGAGGYGRRVRKILSKDTKFQLDKRNNPRDLLYITVSIIKNSIVYT